MMQRVMAVVVGASALMILTACAGISGPEADAWRDYRAGRHAAAVERYDALMSAATTEEERHRIAARLADVYYDWALTTAAATGADGGTAGYAEAVARCRRAAELDPGRRRKFDAAAEKFSRELRTAEYTQTVAPERLDPGAATRRRDIATLMKQAETLCASSRWMAAEDKYRAVLALDPYHAGAVAGLHRVARESRRSARERRHADDDTRLAEAEWRYVQPPDSTPGNNTGVTPPPEPAAPPSLEQRLDAIVFGQLDFAETPLDEVIAGLAKASCLPEAPDGVRFRYERMDPADPAWPTVTLCADEVSLRQALDAICPAVGVTWTIRDETIVLQPAAR